MKVLSLVLVFGTTVLADDICSQPVDRDVKIALVHDSTGDDFAFRAKVDIADALVDLDAWVTESGHDLLVSSHQIGNPAMTGTGCSDLRVRDQPIAEVYDYIVRWSSLSSSNTSPLMAAIIWQAYYEYLRPQFHSERRIYVFATSYFPKLDTAPFPVTEDWKSFQSFCPISSTGTLLQAQEYIRGHGIAVFACAWTMTGTISCKDNWEKWFEEIGITDYYLDVLEGSRETDKAKEHFVTGAKTLICPSWIKSTTTFYPLGPAEVVENCLNLLGWDMGLNAGSDATEFKKRLRDCVYWNKQCY